MLRLACPGCKKGLRVDETKVGAAIVCPACKHKFRIGKPKAEAEPAKPETGIKPKPPPPQPKKADANAGFDVVDEEDIPELEEVEEVKPPPRKPVKKPAPPDDDEEEDDEPQPRKKPKRVKDEEEEEEPEEEEEEEEEEERPKKKKKNKKKGYRSCKEANEAILYAILGFFCCALIFAPLAIQKAVQAKQKIAEDRRLTGEWKAILAMVLAVIDILGWIAGMALRFSNIGG